MSTHSSLASGSLHRNATMLTAESTLHEESDSEVATETSEAGYQDDEGVSALPWHHEQLYRLYGRKVADSFLHPKFETAKRVVAVRSHASVTEEFRGVSAAELWENLRSESRAKQLRHDAAVHPELKYAYSAFVRQSLRRHKPGRRQLHTKDLPELARLLDDSRLRAAHAQRRATQLQFRMSRSNEDRVFVLLHNNPPPRDLHDTAVGPSRFLLPDWDRESSDDGSEWSYKKWLCPPPAEGTGVASPQSSLPQIVAVTDSDGASMAEAAPRLKGRRRSGPRLPPLVFLTERAAARGPTTAFSDRHRAAAEARYRPPGYSHVRSPNSPPPNSPAQRPSTANGLADSWPTQGDTNSGQAQSSWPPLSLSALREYKSEVRAPGSGDFNLGKTAVWKTRAAAVAT